MTDTTPQQMLVLTRGLPASGKSTWAKKWVAEDQENRTRINRDDLRFMTYGSYWFGTGEAAFKMENAITAIQHGAIRAALRSRRSVVVDDTNLNPKFLESLLDIAREFNGRVQVRFQDFAVDIDELIRRDAKRIAQGERGVGADVIKLLSERSLGGGKALPKLPASYYEKITPFEREVYTEDSSLPGAYIFDVDGTLAAMTGRHPFDWHRVDEDDPIVGVIELARLLKNAGYKIIVMSGRSEAARAGTIEWLNAYGVPFDALHMRADNDRRHDSITKRELFEENVRGRYYIKGVFDDRDQVVRMWRDMGFMTAQMEYGDF